MPRTVLITGGCGYLGGVVLRRMLARRAEFGKIIAADLRPPRDDQRLPGIDFEIADVREPAMRALICESHPDTVIHLASIVTPGRDSSRELEYAVDVLGTENVLNACVAAGVQQIIVTSSGAAYGYHADNPSWLTETDPLRGNDTFAYSHHKRLVEEMLARYRETHPELRQLIFRVCTILGAHTRNQITALFEKRFVLGVGGSATPFVFIWDEDAAEAIVRGALGGRAGIYNLAGDGALSMAELAALLGKRHVALPPALLANALRLLRQLGLTQYGPEQVNFLRYRPVLDNAKLKAEFGFTPAKTSLETFTFFCDNNLKGPKH